MTRSLLCLLVLFSWLVPQGVGAGEAAPARSSWACLPANTLGAVRMEDPSAFADALRTRTRLGAMLFGQKRRQEWQRAFEMVRGESWHEFIAALEPYGLAPEDLFELFTGPWGAGFVYEPRPDREPLGLMLAWSEPGPGLLDRLMRAVDRASAEGLEAGTVLGRYDLELAGRRVVQLTLPEAHGEAGVPDRFHVLLARAGGRLLAAVTFPQSKAAVQPLSDEARARIDWDALTGIEEATGVFARFLARHEGGASPFAEAMRDAPGLMAALPGGLPLFEMHFNTPALFRILREAAPGNGGAGDAGAFDGFEVLRRLGITSLGPVAFKATLDERVMRYAGFLSMPAPRPGVLGLFDPAPLPATVPGWVGTEPTGYSHLAFDLAELYRQARKQAIAIGGETVQSGYEQVEQMARMQLQASIPEVLASIGRKHMVLGFKMRMADVEIPDMEGFDPAGGQAPPVRVVRQPQQRMAMVWDLADPALWERLFGVIGMWAGMAGDAVQQVEEQGFTGWRLAEGPVEGGLFLGRGRLVFSIGQGVAESVLAMLRRPPEGEAAMRGGPLHAAGDRLLPPREGFLYALNDYNRQLLDARRVVSETFRQPLVADAVLSNRVDDPKAFMEALLPAEAELDGAFGVMVSQGLLTGDGMVVETALDLPPAK